MFLGFFGRVPRRGPAQRVRLRVTGIRPHANSHGVGHSVVLADRAVR
ncbi:hypothetical protein [Streptomyces albicerus]|nr:hypothetical protein [Streptomyces albicerus]